MRRPTLIMLVVLFVVIGAAAVLQLMISSGGGDPLPGPVSPGQLPSTSQASTSPS